MRSSTGRSGTASRSPVSADQYIAVVRVVCAQPLERLVELIWSECKVGVVLCCLVGWLADCDQRLDVLGKWGTAVAVWVVSWAMLIMWGLYLVVSLSVYWQHRADSGGHFDEREVLQLCRHRA